MILQLIIQSILLLLFCIVAIVLTVHLIQEVTGRAPFVPIPPHILADIVESLELSSESVVYDLGSGDGRVVFAIARSNPQVRAIGVERSFLPYVISNVAKHRHGLQNVKFIRKDFFDISVGEATHVFVYLFPGIMNTLLSKFEKELTPGTKVISCDFKFKNKVPVKIVDLDRKRFDMGRKLYIYEF